ncbi:MAG: hypothetical protein A3C47_06470 [Omnitrophica bacterium RIFCSPHIGHO2_02_FULL_51_18]|nr:MAG: hypothetical protein A3C47_06470 [Omnitrophica bacterium RIFCSPHIGHO2_02_FULL_51_18]
MNIKISNEAKTGVLVLVALLTLGALLLKVGNFGLFKKGYVIKSQFHYTAGVKKNAPVRLSGVDVGEVRELVLHYGDEMLIETVFWIDEGVKIRKDSKAYVTTLGLMGEKYVEIKAGTSSAEYAKPGDEILSQDPVRLEELIEMATQVAGDIGKMAKDISKVANNVNGVIDENKPKLNDIFENLEYTSENFRDFSEDLKWHPWKVLAKGQNRPKEEILKARAEQEAARAKRSHS